MQSFVTIKILTDAALMWIWYEGKAAFLAGGFSRPVIGFTAAPKIFISLINSAGCRFFSLFVLWRELNILTSPVCVYLPAQGSVSRNYVTLPSLAVVWLEDTHTLTGQAVHRQEARLAQTLGLLRPAVHHAARKLIARQELAGIGLIGCREERKKT